MSLSVSLKNLTLAALTAVACLAVSQAAQAHFAWLALEPGEGDSQTANVWFAEMAEPGDAKLLDRIADFQVWAVGNAGQGEPLALETQEEGTLGGWVAELPAEATSLTGSIDYGVITRGEETFMLKYFARYARGAEVGAASGTGLPLDVHANIAEGQLVLTVMAQGQPLADAEVVILTPSYEQIDATSDENGEVAIQLLEGGRYSIRAKQVTSEAGEFEGDAYESVRSYATLTLDLPTPTGETASGSEILSAARKARAVWWSFPGFTSHVTMNTDEGSYEGTLTVAADGTVSLEGIDDDRVMETLRSLIMHRMPGETDADGVTLIEEEGDHPLGQLVNLDYDVAMGSSYRVRDSVVRQVNREAGPMHFSISVLDYELNHEGCYLPTVYTVSMWNAEGALSSTTTVQDSWVQVGEYDLPARHFMVTAGDSKHEYIDLVFSDHQLNENDGE